MRLFCERMQRPAFIRLAQAALFTALLAFSCAFMHLGNPAFCGVAHADGADARPSVLILEAGLGDYTSCSLTWMGEEVSSVAKSGALELTTINTPAWWSASSGKSAPATFLLGCPEGKQAITAKDIIWALDQIKSSGAQPKTFVIAMGATGLPLREYAEDMTSPKQSSRADLVGFAFCGTPQNGYSIMETYSSMTMWEEIAASAGLTAADLTPGSPYLTALDESEFPHACRVLCVDGAIGDLGFGLTDGAGVTAVDFPLAEKQTTQSESVQVNATISRAINLTGQWSPFTKTGSKTNKTVDSALVERLSAMNCYETSDEVISRITEFYDIWFGTAAPVTHTSNFLALDLSGSMLEPIASGASKLDVAKEATDDYLRTVLSYSELPLSAPVNVSVYGFNTSPSLIVEGYDENAISAIKGVSAQGETNIGAVLQSALNTLKEAPTCADRHVLLLSDGATTEGMSDDAMLAELVPAAKDGGVIIDTVGFGDVGESNAAFLQKLADATGGTYFSATDAYSLKSAFLSAYYSGLGLGLKDQEITASQASEDLGMIDVGTGALQIGIVSEGELPDITLSCSGAPLEESSYSIYKGNRFASVQIMNAPVGNYVVDISNAQGKTHLFAVEEQGVSKRLNVVGEKADISWILLSVAGVAFIALLVFVIVRTTRSKSKAGK